MLLPVRIERVGRPFAAVPPMDGRIERLLEKPSHLVQRVAVRRVCADPPEIDFLHAFRLANYRPASWPAPASGRRMITLVPFPT